MPGSIPNASMKSLSNTTNQSSAALSGKNERMQNDNSSLTEETPADIHKNLSSSASVKLPVGVKDAKWRAKSRAYLQQCLQEIAYLTSSSTLNPIVDHAEAEGHVAARPRLLVPELPEGDKEDRAVAEACANATGLAAPAEVSTLTVPTEADAGLAAQSETGTSFTMVAPAPIHAATDTSGKQAPAAPAVASSPSALQKVKGVPDVQLWDVRSTIHAHLDAVRAIVFDASTTGLFSGSDDCTIKYWHIDQRSNASEYKAEQLLTLRGHEAAVSCLVYSKEHRRLYSGGLDATVRAWKLPAEMPSKQARVTDVDHVVYVGNTEAVWGLALFPYQGRKDALLGSVSADGMVRLWHTDDAATSSRLFLSWNYLGTEPSNQAAADQPSVPLPRPTSITAVPSDLSVCAVSYTNGVVKTFALSTGREVRCFATQGSQNGISINSIVGYPTLPLVAAAREDREIVFYDLLTGKVAMELQAHDDSVSCLDFDPSGLTFVSGSHDCKVRFWDMVKHDKEDLSCSAVCFQEVQRHVVKASEGVLAVAFHPSAPLVVTTGADGVICVYG